MPKTEPEKIFLVKIKLAFQFVYLTSFVDTLLGFCLVNIIKPIGVFIVTWRRRCQPNSHRIMDVGKPVNQMVHIMSQESGQIP